MKPRKTRARRPFKIILLGVLVLFVGAFSLAIGFAEFFLSGRLSTGWVSATLAYFADHGLIMLSGFNGLMDIAVGVVFITGGLLIFGVKHMEFGALSALGTGFISTFLFGIGGWSTYIGGVYYSGLGTVYLRLVVQAAVPLIVGAFSLTMEREEAKTVMGRRIRGFWQDFSHNKIGLVGLALLLVYVASAVLVPILSFGISPERAELADNLVPPEWITVFNPSLNSLPRTTTYNLNWTLDLQSVPEGIRNDFNVSYGADGTVSLSLVDAQLNESKPISVRLYSSSFSYPYQPPSTFFITFGESVDPCNVLTGSLPGGKNYTVRRLTAAYNIEVNFTNPLKTMSIWDAEWYYNRITYWFSHTDYMSRLLPIDLAPAYTRLITDVQSNVASLSKDQYWVYRMGFVDKNGCADTDAMARDVFVKPGNYSFEAYVIIAPLSPTKPVYLTASISPVAVKVDGLLWGIMGTDHLGRDVWARVVAGVKISLAIGLSTAVVTSLLGVVVGVFAGFVGGTTDELLMRLVDILMCLPTLPLLMVLVHMYGQNIWYIVILISVFGWLGLARVVRSQVLSLREAPFVDCATASGASKSYIMLRHLVPNVLPVVMADFVLGVPAAILTEAGLSFIGFGDPTTPTWGREFNIMFTEGGAFIHFAWWWILPPGIAMIGLCMAFVFMGHAVDEVVNPRLRRRR